MSRIRLAVLTSGGGRSLRNLLELSKSGALPAEVALVIASKPGIGALAHAAAFGVPSEVAAAADVTAALDRSGAELAVLAGYLKPWPIPEAWVGRAINIHPALLPLFGGKGYYGRRVHEAVLASGMKVSGCTVHFVTPDYDQGPIISQRAVPVLEGDDPDVLAARVFAEELKALPAAITAFAAGRLRLDGRRVVTAQG